MKNKENMEEEDESEISNINLLRYKLLDRSVLHSGLPCLFDFMLGVIQNPMTK